MPVTSVQTDPDQLTMTVEATYDHPVERVWQLWADPRRLERWWGPPEYPATFDRHDLRPGGVCEYHMTGPNGETPRGWWRIREVDEHRAIELEDGFADEHGAVDPSMPQMVMRMTLAERPGGTTMTMVSTFPSREALEQLLAMGMQEGLAAAMAQIDDLLAA